MELFLAIDLGTTGLRSILFDNKLNVKGEDYREYPLITNGTKVEQDANLWFELTVETAKNVIKHSGALKSDIKSISISSQGISFVPVDDELKPLSNAISWLDTRADKQNKDIEKVFGDEFLFRHTGKHNETVYTLPKLLWLKENEPDIWKRTHKILFPMDFLIASLTGKCVTDFSMAAGSLFYDLKNQCWSDTVLDAFNIDKKILPNVEKSGTLIGKVLPSVADMMGVDENCVVSLGAQDQKCAALGVGLNKSNVVVSIGTAGAVVKLWNEYQVGEISEIPWSGYTNRDEWVTEGVINTAGSCVRWLRDTMYKNENYKIIDAEAEIARKKNSQILFCPELGGGDTKGCFYGMNLGTERGDMALSVMEAVAFKICTLMQKMDVSNAENIILLGGGAKSELWCRIIADATGKSVSVPLTEEAAAAGAAILAAKAIGVDIDSLSIKKNYTPSELRDVYFEKYKRYTEFERWVLSCDMYQKC